jgi:uncharacterized protein YndB with AHSA1/START domain
MRKITREVVYPFPPERVWLALTDPGLLAQWLMPNDFAPRVGHTFTFRTDPAPGFDGVVRCEVLEVEAPRRLSYTWRGGPIDTVVSFTLEPVPEGTRLRMEQSGFRGVRGTLVGLMLWSGSRRIYERRLRAVLRRLSEGGQQGGAAGDRTRCAPGGPGRAAGRAQATDPAAAPWGPA